MDLSEAVVWAFAVASTVACLVLGGVVLAGGGRRGAGLWLVVTMAFAAPVYALVFAGVLLQDRYLAYNANVWNVALLFPNLIAYSIFAGAAIPSSILAPLRGRWVRVFLLAAAAVAAIATVAWYASVLSPPIAQTDGTWLVTPQPQFAVVLVTFWVAPFLLSFLGSVDAWRRAPPGTIARQRAAAYMVAFGLWDLDLGFFNAISPALTSTSAFRISSCIVVFVELASVALIVRALLKWNLFDFDLKLKIGLKRGTIAAIILGAALIAGQLAQAYLSTTLGVVIGAITAGVVLLALKPIERVADRIANTAMPRVNMTPEYLSYKKLEVYRAAVESAIESGTIDARERDILSRLRTKLGIGAEDAIAVEGDVRARLGTLS